MSKEMKIYLSSSDKDNIKTPWNSNFLLKNAAAFQLGSETCYSEIETGLW